MRKNHDSYQMYMQNVNEMAPLTTFLKYQCCSSYPLARFSRLFLKYQEKLTKTDMVHLTTNLDVSKISEKYAKMWYYQNQQKLFQGSANLTFQWMYYYREYQKLEMVKQFDSINFVLFREQFLSFFKKLFLCFMAVLKKLNFQQYLINIYKLQKYS